MKKYKLFQDYYTTVAGLVYISAYDFFFHYSGKFLAHMPTKEKCRMFIAC